MGVVNRETGEILARIVYFGAAGAGTSTNLSFIHRKLRREHRGELEAKEMGGATYEHLPVELGSVRGFQTTIHIYSVPAGDEHRELRGRILQGADGIVFVADLRPDRHKATQAAWDELKEHFAEQRRSLDDVILVAQYNHRDGADENDIEALHRQLRIKPAAYFECAASLGTGVLQTLTSLSKLILNHIRAQADAAEEGGGALSLGVTQHLEPLVEPEPEIEVEPEPEPEREFTIPPASAEIEPMPGADKGLRIESAGPVHGTDCELEIPLRLIEQATGRAVELTLRLSLDRE
jgi:hypothetical protein